MIFRDQRPEVPKNLENRIDAFVMLVCFLKMPINVRADTPQGHLGFMKRISKALLGVGI